MKKLMALFTALAGLAPVGAQEKSGARDMYFGGLEAASPAAASRHKLPAVAAAASAASRRQIAPRERAVANAPQTESTQTVAKQRQIDEPSSTKPQVPVINAARSPLGLRYSLLKMNGAEGVEVPASTRFHSGDRLQLQIQANADGYLYIVSQGSSGAWQVMFPSASRNQGSNRIQAGDEHSSIFRFDAKPGVERIFVVLSRVPERDLDSVIYNLKGATSEPSTVNPRPAPAPQAPLMLAGNLTVTDPLVSRLRTTYARDLVLEEVASPAQAERAMYVVNKTSGPESRVVADIKLTHE